MKATFFVTGANSSYYNMIGEAYRRGHTIAIHTYSHVYSDIYSSVDNYLADFNKIKDKINYKVHKKEKISFKEFILSKRALRLVCPLLALAISIPFIPSFFNCQALPDLH